MPYRAWMPHDAGADSWLLVVSYILEMRNGCRPGQTEMKNKESKRSHSVQSTCIVEEHFLAEQSLAVEEVHVRVLVRIGNSSLHRNPGLWFMSKD